MQLLTTAPRIISWIIGYAVLLSYFSLGVYNFADRDISYNLPATFQLLAFLWLLSDLWIINDWFWYHYGHPSFISKEKKNLYCLFYEGDLLFFSHHPI
jgi:hypothetical protein